MNISFVKDPASALFGNRNPFSLPMQLVAKNAQPMQINPQLACSILSQSSIGFSTQKPLQLPLNTVLSDQRIIGPGALLNQPDLSHLQSVLTTGLIRNDSLAAAQFRNLQAETHTDDSTIKASLMTQVLNSKKELKELEEKFQAVLNEKELLQRRLNEYEQKEFAKIPLRRPVEYVFVPKKKRTRRPATQIARCHQCPIAECQKSYGSDTSLNLHIRKKHPAFKMPEKEESE